jgi:hypothetical protein
MFSISLRRSTDHHTWVDDAMWRNNDKLIVTQIAPPTLASNESRAEELKVHKLSSQITPSGNQRLISFFAFSTVSEP